MDEEIRELLQPGISILIEGDIASRKEIFSYIVLKEGVDKGNKVAVLSFNLESHKLLFEMLKESNISKFEASDELTELGMIYNDIVKKGNNIIYSDIFLILTSKNPPNLVINAYTFNIKNLKRNNVIYLESIDPSSVDEKYLFQLESIFDVVILVKRKKDTFVFKYKKHPTKDTEKEHEVKIKEYSLSKKNESEIYESTFKYEINNALLYGENIESFDSEGQKIIMHLIRDSLKHALINLDMLIKTNRKKEVPSKEKISVLEEGLKEERMMKDIYSKMASQTKDTKTFTTLSNEERIHEKNVLKLLKKYKKI
jgi:hypothetical protein